jgi:hypothetical protein
MENTQKDVPHSSGDSKGPKNLYYFGLDFKKEFSDAFEIIKLNKAKMKEVAGRKSATKMGIIFILVPLILNSIFFGIAFGGGYTLYSTIINLISMVVVIFLMSLIAQKFFNGKGNHEEFFRVISYSYLLMWATSVLALLTALGMSLSVLSLFSLVMLVAGIWSIVIAYHTLIDLHSLTSQNAILTIIIAIIGSGIVMAILMSFAPTPYLYNADAEMMKERFDNWGQFMRGN